MDDTRVYVPLRDGSLVALDRERGTTLWAQEIVATTAPLVRDGSVFVATAAGISELDAATGEQRWTTPIGGTVKVPLTWASGWLVAVLELGEVVGLRAADGAIPWRRPLGATTSHTAVAGDNSALYFSLNDGRVMALALDDGRPLWETKLPGTLSEPTSAPNRVFVGSTDNFFYALDAEDGRLEWKWRGGGDVIGAAADDELVYFASLDNIVRAVNIGNGNQRWRKETATRPVLPPHAFGGIVVVPGLAPAITVFVGDTGGIQGTYAVEGTLFGPPLLDRSPKPFRVTFVTVTREGVIEGLRSKGLMFREPAVAPLLYLPGRPLTRERLP